MKKLSTLLLFALLCAMPFVFTSCNEPNPDETLAMLVDGSWDGKMDISYSKNGVTYNSTGTHVQFWSGNDLTAGYGKWCNTFADNAPYPYLSYDFTWFVKNQVIFLQFNIENTEYANRSQMKIGTYIIDAAAFTGKISNMDNSKSAKFELIHTSSPWAWDVYPVIYPWDIYPFYPWYDPWYDPFYW
jgi:hypothetical protein